MRDLIFENLFKHLIEDDADQLWEREIAQYINSGGDILVTNPDNGWTLLHYAAENLFSNVVNLLLSSGIPVDVRDSNGSTPYLVALDASIDAAIQNDESNIDFSTVKILIENGADVEACSTDGISRDSLLENYGERAMDEYKLIELD